MYKIEISEMQRFVLLDMLDKYRETYEECLLEDLLENVQECTDIVACSARVSLVHEQTKVANELTSHIISQTNVGE